MTRLAVLISFASLTFAASCGFYFNDDDDPCDFGWDTAEDRAPEVGRRNPYSGQCEFSGGGPFPCDDECGPCANGAEAPSDDFQASWAFCEDQCTWLDESTCLEAEACRGIYNENLGFEACWGTDLSGPIRGGDCTAFDALECSQHDDCFAVHASPCGVDQAGLEEPSCDLGEFLRCGNENDPGTCYGEILCDSDPPACPADSMPGIKDGCWTGFCIPIDQCEAQPVCNEVTEEFSCIARGDCAPQYRGIDCVCDDLGCTCADHEFESCEAAGA